MAAGRARPCSAHLLRQLPEADQTEAGKAQEQAAQTERPARSLGRFTVDQKPSVVGHFTLPGIADGRQKETALARLRYPRGCSPVGLQNKYPEVNLRAWRPAPCPFYFDPSTLLAVDRVGVRRMYASHTRFH